MIWDHGTVLRVVRQHLTTLDSDFPARALLEGMRDAGIVRIGELPSLEMIEEALEIAGEGNSQ
jgi:hypothetical protein